MHKALEIQCPKPMLEFLQFHSELLYHPTPAVVNGYFEACAAQGYDSVKEFF